MPILKNAKHEAFAQAVADGASAAEAYTKKVSKGKCSKANAETSGPALARSPQVALRIQELKGSQAEKAEMSRDDLRKWCERILRANPSEASEDSDICETVMTKAGPFTALCSKVAAFDRLVKLCGWNEPERTDSKLEIVIRKL